MEEGRRQGGRMDCDGVTDDGADGRDTDGDASGREENKFEKK